MIVIQDKPTLQMDYDINTQLYIVKYGQSIFTFGVKIKQKEKIWENMKQKKFKELN